MRGFGTTFFFYLGRQFLTAILVILVTLMIITYCLDIVELLRRSAGREGIGIGGIFLMAGLRLPLLGLKLLPFAVLFGVMATLSQLTRSHELIVCRSVGLSVWQFLIPGLVIAAMLGMLAMMVINPVAAAMAAGFEQMEARYLRGRVSLLAVSETGLWLRQSDPKGQSVIHALRVSSQGSELADVIIFLYDNDGRFAGRIDAEKARLQPGYWDLDDVLITGPNKTAQKQSHYQLSTSLTFSQIQESFAPPETMSFWTLPGFIDTLEGTGFSAQRHRLHWYQLLALPLLLSSMVLIAAPFSLRLTRRGWTSTMIASGVGAGFLVYFLSDIASALGLSANIPLTMAAFAPASVSILLGTAALIHLEDG